MRFWKEEDSYDYDKYKFSYSSYLEYENGDKLSEIYKRGFLPMSAGGEIKKKFYEARSFRVPLKDFELTSENKRVLRKFEDKGFERVSIPAKEFDFTNIEFRQFIETYLTEVLELDGKEKSSHVLETDLITDVVIYLENAEPVGYVFLVQDKDISHYWFSFYSPNLKKQSFGIYMMLQEIMEAKDSGREYIYLGTCYGQKGKYKMNFKPYECWDGREWSQEIREN